MVARLAGRGGLQVDHDRRVDGPDHRPVPRGGVLMADHPSIRLRHIVPCWNPSSNPTPPLPTRWWSGRGTLANGCRTTATGSRSWLGSAFGDTEVMGVSNMEATADGIPSRMGIRVGIDETRDDIQHAVTGRDMGPVATTLFFVYRETGADDWSLCVRRNRSAGDQGAVGAVHDSRTACGRSMWKTGCMTRIGCWWTSGPTRCNGRSTTGIGSSNLRHPSKRAWTSIGQTRGSA